MKKYVFKDICWWEYEYSPDGEKYQVELWSCIKGGINYSNDSMADCYIAALYKEGILNVFTVVDGALADEDIYGWSLDQLKQLCEDNGIEVVFVNDEDLKL